MTYVYPLWFFLAAFFLYFAFTTWRDAREDLRLFVIRRRPQGDAPDDPGLASAASRQQFGALIYTASGILSLVSLFLLLFAR